ncbi:MAG: peptidase MA family metallohydrolase [Anaerolineae bacterium]
MPILRRVAVAAFLVVAVAFGLRVHQAAADNGPIKVTSNTASASFANEIKFELAANSSAGQIKQADLYYTFGDGKASNKLPAKIDNAAGNGATITASKRVQQGEFAPQLDISYYWKLTDAAGNTLQTPPQTLRYADERFGWQETSNDRVTVFWYGQNDKFGQQMLDWATQGLDRLEKTFGIKMSYPIHVVVYGSKDEMAKALAPRGAVFDGGATVLGEARSQYGTLLMLNAADARTTLWHELGHLVLHDRVKGPFESSLPAWVDEGLAMYNESDDPNDNYKRALDGAIGRDDVFRVRSMTSPNGVPAKVGIWYGQARSIVTYLLETGGKDKLIQFVDLLGKGSRTDDALKKVYGFDQDQLNDQWREWVGLKPQGSAAAPAPAAQNQTPPQTAPDNGSSVAPASPDSGATQARPSAAAAQPSRAALALLGMLGLAAVCSMFLLLILVFGGIAWYATRRA